MPRLKVTLGEETLAALRRRTGAGSMARVARELIEEGLARRSGSRSGRAKLIRDYVAGRDEALELLDELEPAAVRWGRRS